MPEGPAVKGPDAKEQDGRIACGVCPHACALLEGQTGLCRARQAKDGKNISLNYGVITGIALDPIEKKPLYRFFPGSRILSVGSFGCNLKCPFCQNHEISQKDAAGCEPFSEHMTPEELAGLASELAKKEPGNLGIAYTYNEPLIGWEFVYDTAVLIRKAGLKNVFVTNGCVKSGILEKLLPFANAMNIDLKCFSKEGYERLGGDLDTVLSFIGQAHRAGCHIELTSLIVPGLNDSEEDMDREAEWIADLSEEIPLHITRYFPNYRMREPGPTDIALMKRLKEIAERYLSFVYLGNV
ncbi:MAG: AmmeMemoRadiSam system radical SAM enzyme [Lachnospiraceae bacterium]|nr:AmmeMemoRadiSam system radical SAM enzyme [Lachnospiraceae bacterium]